MTGREKSSSSTSSSMFARVFAFKEVQLLFAVGGIYASYLQWAVMQEKINKTTYYALDGEPGGRFTFSFFLMFVQAVFNVLVAAAALALQRHSLTCAIPFSSFALVSLFQLGAGFSSNKALAFVDYPTQVLAKSCKPIPVMLMSVVVLGERYPAAKYACVLLVTIGIALFLFKQRAASAGGDGADDDGVSLHGYALLATSLALDGLCGPTQQKLFRNVPAGAKPSSTHLMFAQNAWQALWSLAIIVVIGEAAPALRFIAAHPAVLVDLFWFGVCSAAGQNFIFYTIAHFGALVCSTATTTRKFFTILASVVLFNHPLAPRQWLGVAFVFAGLIADVLVHYFGKKPAVAVPKKKE